MASTTFAFDRQTARSFDADGRMRVKDCVLSTAEVNPYYGKEVVDWESLGLDPEKVYELYRDPEELGSPATIESFQGVPLMIKHVAQTADDPRKEYQAGSVHSVYFDGKKLRGDLLVSDGRAIDLIESDQLADLSCGYRYEPVRRSGTANGKPYDLRMSQIRGNHVALVDDGRASGAHVADSAFRNPNMPDPSLQGNDTMPDIMNGRQPGAAPMAGANDAPPAAAPAPAAGGDGMAQVGAALKELVQLMTQQHQAILQAVGGQGGGAAAPAPDEQAADTDGGTPTSEHRGAEEHEPEAGPMHGEGAEDSEHEMAEDEDEDGEQDEKVQHAEDELDLERAVPGESEGEGSNPAPEQRADNGAARTMRVGTQGGTSARGKDTPFGAMDAKTVKAHVAAAVKQERVRAAAVETAKREVLGVLGPVYGMDSAGAIYREALKQVGVDVKQIPRGMAGVAWRAHKAATMAAAGVRPNPELAMDSSGIDANQKSLLQHLSRITVKG
jgi:hypothetical protein